MTHISDRVFGDHPQRARNDLVTSWDHLVSAAGHGGKQVARTSRRRGRIGRERAGAARRALLGELPSTPWRWLGAGLATGLAAGLAIGAVGPRVLARARRSTANEAVRERTRAAVQGATAGARGAAVTFRDKLIRRDSQGELETTDAVASSDHAERV